jgi:UDP-N-acetylglucosamine 4,6-dehydratase
MCEYFDNDPRLRFFIGDVRDRNRLALAMRGVRYVIHAAALKRVQAVEYNWDEAHLTNVEGTRNVIHAAVDSPGMQRVVLVSTDKACEPTTAYGQSKAYAERCFLQAKHLTGGKLPAFAIVRYGNVAGSTGSVIPSWRRALAEGKPCEMRDPSATRFWMTRAHAVEYVLSVLVEGRSNAVHTPILPAYRLSDLAAAMGVMDFKHTVLADGEKLHESMLPGKPSSLARRMTIEELREELAHV